jgi:hypothetical protein
MTRKLAYLQNNSGAGPGVRSRPGFLDWLGYLPKLIVFLYLSYAPASVYAEAVDIHKVQAVFLFNLAGFVTWPESTFPTETTYLTFCILGETPTGSYLEEAIRGEEINKHPLAVNYLDGMAGVEQCQLLLLGENQASEFPEIFSKIKDLPILTISSRTGFSSNGGMLTLSKQGGRLHPIVNLSVVEKSGLKISSKLLRLATIVRSGTGDGQ